jgi:hypothetical protein
LGWGRLATTQVGFPSFLMQCIGVKKGAAQASHKPHARI